MPGYKGHLVGGAVAYVGILVPMTLIYTPTPIVALEWFICALAGSLFPDIDIKSKGQKYFYYVFIIWILLLFSHGYYTYVAYSSLMSMTPMIVKHRGIFHRYWFITLVPFSLWFVGYTYAPNLAKIALPHVLFFIFGAISHLVLDYNLSNFWFFKLPFFGTHATRK